MIEVNHMNMKRFILTLVLIITQHLFLTDSGRCETVLDSVAASVNGMPITVSEVNARLNPPRRLTAEQASTDPEFRYALDQIIQEMLIKEEAKSRRIPAVGADDIEGYLVEVAKRNGIERSALDGALKKEGVNIENYKQKIEIDILKSKLAASLARDGAGVTNEEIESYAREHPEFSQSGTKVKLHQILISNTARDGTIRSDSDSEALIEKINRELADGKDFTELAKLYSDGPEAKDGGSLGVVLERELSPAILDAVLLLKAGETSEVVESPAGYHIFLLEERFSEDSGATETIKAEIRSLLERQKIEEKMMSFFTVDLIKKHNVEKKI